MTAHVSSRDGSVSEELSRGDGQSTVIDATSPYWMPVRIDAANPQIPLKDGAFVVVAPPAFIADAPARFSARWIDFYR